MKTTNKKPVVQKEGLQKEQPKIKPDYPLSEKDEVKKAEDKLRKSVKKLL